MAYCEDCVYAYKGEHFIECRKLAPKAYYIVGGSESCVVRDGVEFPNGLPSAYWPIVGREDFCGEWRGHEPGQTFLRKIGAVAKTDECGVITKSATLGAKIAKVKRGVR